MWYDGNCWENEERTLPECDSAFEDSSSQPLGSIDDVDPEDFDDPAWCDGCNRDTAFCICTKEQMREEAGDNCAE